MYSIKYISLNTKKIKTKKFNTLSDLCHFYYTIELNNNFEIVSVKSINNEFKNDLIAAWNELEEVKTSIDELTDKDLIECREAIKDRVNLSFHWLSKHVNESDIIEEL